MTEDFKLASGIVCGLVIMSVITFKPLSPVDV